MLFMIRRAAMSRRNSTSYRNLTLVLRMPDHMMHEQLAGILDLLWFLEASSEEAPATLLRSYSHFESCIIDASFV